MMQILVACLLPATGFAHVLSVSTTQARGMRGPPYDQRHDDQRPYDHDQRPYDQRSNGWNRNTAGSPAPAGGAGLPVPASAQGSGNGASPQGSGYGYPGNPPHRQAQEEGRYDRYGARDGACASHEIRQTLTNGDDVIFTLPISVGGQMQKAIPDTGSFSLLVFSNRCAICNAPNAYDQHASQTFSTEGFQAEQNFGSGSSTSIEAYDAINIGDMHVDRQVFWEVIDADAGFRSMTFNAILGAGPPRSNTIMTEQELQYIDQELKNAGQDMHETNMGDLQKHFQDMYEHAKNQTMVVNHLHMCTYSVCLPMHHGVDGLWIWNDVNLVTNRHLFATVPINGDIYWSAELSDVKLSGGIVQNSMSLGCTTGRCNAVVDTGTSLLVVPTEAYTALVNAVDQWGCSDFNNLPQIELTLGGTTFTLPPDSYVGELYGDLPSGAREMMPHAAKQLDQMKPGDGSACSLLVMTIDEDSPQGQVWILGLPWFRKYYTSFELSSDMQTASRMHFAEKDSACNPTSAQGLARQDIRRGPTMRLDASKIRTPRHRLATQKAARLLRESHLKRGQEREAFSPL